MKRRSISALSDRIVVRAVNSPDPHLVAEAVLPLLLAFLEANAKTQGPRPEAPAAGEAATQSLDASA
jgi:hypothetical protein